MSNATPAWMAHIAEGAPVHPDLTPRSLQSYLDEAAEKYGDHTAVIFQNLRLTYRQLKDRAEAFAASLRGLGVNPGDRVAIMMPNMPQTVISFWGALKAGAVVVMTNPLYMEKELTHHFTDSNPKVLITMDLFWSKIAPLRDKLKVETYVVSRIADGLAFPLNLLQPLQARKQGTWTKIACGGSVVPWKKLAGTSRRYSCTPEEPAKALALLQYTGGTTGFSKGAMLTHANLSSQIQQLMAIIQCDASNSSHIFLSIMPFFHVFGLVGTMLLPTVMAAPTIPVPRFSPHEMLELIKKHRPTFFVGAPSIYISLMQQKDISRYDLTCIKLCISGSSPFPQASMKQFQELTHAHITEGFGLTEASPVVAANPLYGLQKIGSIGIPIPETEVRIISLDDGTTELGDNESGELVVRGPQVMLGYWNHPEETAAPVVDGWLHTGDIAYRDSDGYYYIVDRKKDMAIVGGYNVFPREIDEVLHEYPKIKEAVSLSVPHKFRGEILKAYIVPKDGEKISKTEIAAFLRSKLADYKVPKLFEFREELPKSLVGKVLRRALREEEENRLAAGSQADGGAPSAPTPQAPQEAPGGDAK
ncbi:MAG: long-chain fatty acid--CoA ligase [Mailhella sp.]|nr:long-chain fatty acid--CoA ligase [Mailhella sp.]